MKTGIIGLLKYLSGTMRVGWSERVSGGDVPEGKKEELVKNGTSVVGVDRQLENLNFYNYFSMLNH